MAAIMGMTRYGTGTIGTNSMKGHSTSTWASNEASDTDQMYFYYDYEETKTQSDEKFERLLKKEELNLPSFQIVKNLHKTKKVKTFVENRQQNFNIRNAL